MTTDPQRDSKSDLLDAARAAVKDREDKALEQALASRAVPRPRGPIGILLLLGLAGIVLLVLQPEWLVGPASVGPDPVPVAAAGLRVTLIRQRQLVFDFARTHGRLPVSLAEVGDSADGVSYRRVSDTTFTLVGSAGDSVLVLQSSDTQSVFLGNALKILKNRGGQ